MAVQLADQLDMTKDHVENHSSNGAENNRALRKTFDDDGRSHDEHSLRRDTVSSSTSPALGTTRSLSSPRPPLRTPSPRVVSSSSRGGDWSLRASHDLAPFLAGDTPTRSIAVFEARALPLKAISDASGAFGSLTQVSGEFQASRGVVFLTFADVRDAQLAEKFLAARLRDAHVPGTATVVARGLAFSPIAVDDAKNLTEQLKNWFSLVETRTVTICGMPAQTQECDLKAVFSQNNYADILDVVATPSSPKKNADDSSEFSSFDVTFSSRLDAERAVAELAPLDPNDSLRVSLKKPSDADLARLRAFALLLESWRDEQRRLLLEQQLQQQSLQQQSLQQRHQQRQQHQAHYDQQRAHYDQQSRMPPSQQRQQNHRDAAHHQEALVSLGLSYGRNSHRVTPNSSDFDAASSNDGSSLRGSFPTMRASFPETFSDLRFRAPSPAKTNDDNNNLRATFPEPVFGSGLLPSMPPLDAFPQQQPFSGSSAPFSFDRPSRASENDIRSPFAYDHQRQLNLSEPFHHDQNYDLAGSPLQSDLDEPSPYQSPEDRRRRERAAFSDAASLALLAAPTSDRNVDQLYQESLFERRQVNNNNNNNGGWPNNHQQPPQQRATFNAQGTPRYDDYNAPRGSAGNISTTDFWGNATAAPQSFNGRGDDFRGFANNNQGHHHHPAHASQQPFVLSSFDDRDHLRGSPLRRATIPVPKQPLHHHPPHHRQQHGLQHHGGQVPPLGLQHHASLHSSHPHAGFPPVPQHHQPQPSGPDFAFDFERVASGNDQRTTLMVRNIPNKYTQQAVLEEINVKFNGCYDFFYLPIDFKNKCNMGYAFINFVHAIFIVDFFMQLDSQKWPTFNSDKICKIRYGRIQGK